MKIKFISQHDETDCGAACLAIILSFFRKSVPLYKIRNYAATDTKGTSGLGIIQAARKMSLSCEGFSLDSIKNLDLIPCPSIFQIFENNLEHYVVLVKTSDNSVLIYDPAVGKRKIKKSEFMNKCSGVFFIFSPNEGFNKTKGENTFIRLIRILSEHKASAFQIIVSSILLSAFGIFMSFYFRYLIDEVLYTQVKSTLNICSISYFLVIIFQVITGFCRNQIILYMSSKIEVSLAIEFFCHLLKLPLNFFSSRKTGEILSRTNDINTIKNAVSSSTISVVIDSFMLLAGSGFLIKLGGRLLPVALIPVLVSALIVFCCKRPYRQKIREQAVMQAEKNAFMYESINGISTVKGLSCEDKVKFRFEQNVVDTAEKNLELGKLTNNHQALNQLVSSLGTLALYWYGSILIFNGIITLGQLISFCVLSSFFLNPLHRLLTMQSYWQEVNISIQRFLDVMESEEEKYCEDKNEMDSVYGDIVFKDVSFSYGYREKTLDKINLTIPRGKKVAFVGKSGSGKTTLLKLLMRFYKCDEGSITISDKEIEDFELSSYRKKIGYVPQESILFRGTVMQNLTFAENNNLEKIDEAVKKADAYDFISKLPEKFETVVGERGATLSGGERQRLSLARVFMKNPKLILLDEATASLDSISEEAIMNSFYSDKDEKTLIIIAHRLSTIRDCDLICVFDKGHIVEKGTHEQLLKRNKKYAELWRAQNEKNNNQAY